MILHRLSAPEVKFFHAGDRDADDPVNPESFQMRCNAVQNPCRDSVSAEFGQHHHIQQIRIADAVGQRPLADEAEQLSLN